jgi:hypothetical protein
MKITRFKTPALVAMVAAGCLVHTARGQEAAGSAGQTQASLAGGTGIYAELNGGVDSKKAKVGDAINLHTTEPVKSNDDRMILPKGTKVVGHITESQARSKGGDVSALGVVFDKAVLKDGREVPLSVVVQAMGAPVVFSDTGGSPPPDPAASGTMRTSPMGGGGRNAPTASQPPTAGVGSGATLEGNSSAPLGPNSRGVLGLRGLTLNTVPTNNVFVAMLTSDGKNVHLDNGTRFLLVAQASEVPAK